MTRNIKTIIACLLCCNIVAALTSCGEDFLEVQSKTEGTTGNFYNS